MKKTIFAALMLFTALTAGAQDVNTQGKNVPMQTAASLRFGFFSYQDVLQSAPDMLRCNATSKPLEVSIKPK